MKHILSKTLRISTLTTLIMLLFSANNNANVINSVKSGSWDDPTVWNTGTVPTANDEVVIKNSHVVQATNYVKCASLTIQSPIHPTGVAQLQINNNFEVAGNVVIDGYVDGSGQNGKAVLQLNNTITVGGKLEIKSFNSDNVEIDNFYWVSAFNLLGDFSISGPVTWNISNSSGIQNGVINLAGTVPQTLPVTSGVVFNNVTFNNTSQAGATIDGNITENNVAGNINVQSGVLNTGGYQIIGNQQQTFEVGANATVILSGNSTMPSGFNSIVNPGSNVEFTGVAPISAGNYSNLTISGSSARTLNGDITVGNLSIITGNTLDVSSHNISISGNFSNEGNVVNMGNVSFNGSTAQTVQNINENLVVNGITVNKSGGNVVLNNPLNVNNSLSLVQGNIVTTASNLLTIESNASIIGGSISSYVEGPLAIVTNTNKSYKFDVGTSSNYKQVTITPSSAIQNTTYIVQSFDQAFGNTSSLTSTIQSVNNTEYVNIDVISAPNGQVAAKVTLSFNTNSNVSDISTLTVTNWTGTEWINSGVSNITGNANNGTITSEYVNTFGVFAIGNQKMGPTFIGEVESFDNKITVFPNPAVKGENINISFEGFNNNNNNEEILVILYDVLGNETYSKVIPVNESGSQVVALDPSDKLTSGVYYITGTSKNQYTHQRLVIQ